MAHRTSMSWQLDPIDQGALILSTREGIKRSQALVEEMQSIIQRTMALILETNDLIHRSDQAAQALERFEEATR